MTHQNHQTNGASLEDCHTNFYALTDLCGIKWRKFVKGERPNASSDPLDDPILRSYSRCMQADLLCVWRRVQSTKPDNTDPNALVFEISTSKVHPPLSLAAAKELWIFWYGEEPDLSELVDAELLRIAANQALWNGTWKGELTYECRSLLFKALHNLMERFVLTKDIVRFGKWFVQPCTSSDRMFERSSQHLSFSFTFFVHGDTVCASIDLREHPAVRPLTKVHLAEAAAVFSAATNSTQSQENENGNATSKSPDNGNSNEYVNASNGGANSSSGDDGSGSTPTTTPKPRKVILAPFGMAAILTGNSYKASDPMAEKILEDWASFFPLCNKDSSDVPPVVEVILGGHKMYHPTNYVLVTDLDDIEDLELSELQKLNNTSAGVASSSSEAAALASLSSTTNNNNNTTNANTTSTPPTSLKAITGATGASSTTAGGNDAIKTDTSTAAITNAAAISALERLSFQPYYDQRPTSGFTFNTSNTHILPTAAVEMPERAWQDCITNPLHVAHVTNSLATSAATSNTTTSNTTGGNDMSTSGDGDSNNLGDNEKQRNISQPPVDSKQEIQQQIQLQQQQQRQQFWNCIDPLQKAPCICTNSQKSSCSKKMATTTTTTTANTSISSTNTTSVGIAAMRLGQTVGKTSSHGFISSSSGISSNMSSSLQSSIFGSSHYVSHHLLQQQQQQQHHQSQQQHMYQQQQHYRPSTPSNNSTVAESLYSSSSSNNNNSNNSRTPSSHVNNKRNIPFHKRFLDDLPRLTTTAITSITTTANTTTKSYQTKSSMGGGARSSTISNVFYQTSTSSSTIDTIPKTRHLSAVGSTPHGTPHGGASTYSRNSIGDSMPVPSVGSPATPAPSPHPNSAHSLPTSVPPAEQLLQMSPHGPTSVSNLQQPPTPIDHLLLDKNTPAPTPTDQHDSKSITASPYLHPTPSVEPPPYNDSFISGGGGGGGQQSTGPGSVPQPPSVGRSTTPTQQQGTISVKKFELQQALTPLGSGGGSIIGITEIKQEPGIGNSCSGASSARMGLLNNNTDFTVSSSNTNALALSTSEAVNNILNLYKPPKVIVKDSDSFYDEDWLKEVIYDFSFQESWDYLPVKRHKPNDLLPRFIRRPRQTKNLYEGHTHFKPLMPSPGSVYGQNLLTIDGNSMGTNALRTDTMNNTTSGINSSGGLIGIVGGGNNATNSGLPNGTDDADCSSLTNRYFQGLDIKTEPGMHSPCKESKSTSTGGNLYTAEGLNPSLNDLEQLFETSSNDECNSVQIHTPPDSNNPSNGGCSTVTNTIDELKRSTAVASAVAAAAAAAVAGNATMVALQNCTNSSNHNSSNNNSCANTIQAEDLTKMFPTPPSHEQQHPNSSPCPMDVHMTDLSVITTLDTTTVSIVPSITGMGGGGGNSGILGSMIKIKQEYSVELGSPIEEPIDDWSFVYKPPQQEKFVGSSRYAPLTNLPSQTLPPLLMPQNSVYKPTWTKPKARAAAAVAKAAAVVQHQQQQQQQKQQQQMQQQQQQQQQKHQQLHDLLSSGPRTPLQQPRTPLGPIPSPMHNTVPPPLNSGGSNLLLTQLNCPQAALTNTASGGASMQHMMQRAGMSPISPAPSVPYPRGSPALLQNRQTPIHPPPPYELAVASPATSTSSYSNKQYNSQEHPAPHTPQSVGMSNMHTSGPHSLHGAGANTQNMTLYSGGVLSVNRSAPQSACNNSLNELPEVNSVMVNILLYDTALNVFRDHNFDSSTVCVCNADTQKIGNIRGADSGIYAPLPGSSFNPSPENAAILAQKLTAALNKSNGNSSGGMRMINSGLSGGVGCALGSPALMPGAGSGHNTGGTNSSSCTPPSSNNHITGYVDEDPVDCTCGFSAVVNRRLSYRAGLFYEDELEITGIADDPGRHRQPSLLSMVKTLCRKNQTSKIETDKSSNGQMEQLAYAIFDMLLDQCSIIQTASSSVHRALQRHRRQLSRPQRIYGQSSSIATIANVMEFMDAHDIVCLALEQARLAFDNQRMDINEFGGSSSQFNSRNQHLSAFHALTAKVLGTNRLVTMHKWPYIPVGFTRSNKEIVRTMNSIQPMLQHAFHSRSRSATGSKDATYTVSGPLTWRQFHRLAGRASGQCEPQPIPSVIVGYDRDWISVAPHSIHYWDKFLLEPYSYARDVVYLVICPDNDYIISNTRIYFRELSSMYELCKLGKHTPIRGWDGMMSVSCLRGDHQTTPLDDWLRTLENTQLAEQIRCYAVAFLHQLAPYMNRVPSDKTLLDPPDQSMSGNSGSANGLRSSERPNSNSSPNGMTTGGPDGEKLHNTTTSPKLEPNEQTGTVNSNNGQDHDSKSDIKPDTATKPAIVLGDPLGVGETLEDINPQAIVLYVVNPFTFGTDAPELERLALVALFRCYAELLKLLPDSVRMNMNIQIISLESIMELGLSGSRKRFSDEIKCLALNIFSQSRRHLIHAQSVKSLTGFGTAANMEAFLKTKDEQNRRAYKMYTPPFVLAPMQERNDKTDFSRASAGMRGPLEQKNTVMYCNYCLSEDQGWLLATATDDRGELLEKICINIDVPYRARRRKVPARYIALTKLMDFIMGIISQSTQTWRIVIGRIGRIGHSELKSWSFLLSKQHLQKVSKYLKDMCKQCTLMFPPTILSACLVTLEPDAKLRVMSDQFTHDERFSQISMQNPLSTPQDVTCTHILVFPTSAVCLSYTRQFTNETQVDLDHDFFNLEEEEGNEGFSEADLGELFWDNIGTDNMDRNSNHGSPGRIEDNPSWQSAGGNNFKSIQPQDVEEVGSLNQQPLAVGYMVSTAPTGRMPAWFWSACPHLEDVCPVFLKTALHLHVPNIQTTDDILNSTNAHQSANDHPLDSNLTADVLRFVLEGYNALSWLALDSNTHDRLSCLPINVQTLMDLYYLTSAMA